MRISDWSSDVCSSDLRDHFNFQSYRAKATPDIYGNVADAVTKALRHNREHSTSNRTGDASGKRHLHNHRLAGVVVRSARVDRIADHNHHVAAHGCCFACHSAVASLWAVRQESRSVLTSHGQINLRLGTEGCTLNDHKKIGRAHV